MSETPKDEGSSGSNLRRQLGLPYWRRKGADINPNSAEGSETKGAHEFIASYEFAADEQPQYQRARIPSFSRLPPSSLSKPSYESFKGDPAINKEIFHFENGKYTTLYRIPNSQSSEAMIDPSLQLSGPGVMAPPYSTQTSMVDTINYHQVPAFGLTFPLSGFPEPMRKGFKNLLALYSNGHDGKCIADSVRLIVPMAVFNYKDPLIELAVVMVIVLGNLFSPPKPMEGSQEHTGDKCSWMAILFLKMMLFKFREFSSIELNAKLSHYEGHQGINNAFLVKIGWVAFHGQRNVKHPLLLMEDLVLTSEDLMEHRLNTYKQLIAGGNSAELVKQIFDKDYT